MNTGKLQWLHLAAATCAALAASADVVQFGIGRKTPTLDGKVKYKIPEGTQTGTVFRLRGKGIPNLRGGGRGDQYVSVQVSTPTGLTKEQKELLKQFGETLGENPSGGKKRKKKL